MKAKSKVKAASKDKMMPMKGMPPKGMPPAFMKKKGAKRGK